MERCRDISSSSQLLGICDEDLLLSLLNPTTFGTAHGLTLSEELSRLQIVPSLREDCLISQSAMHFADNRSSPSKHMPSIYWLILSISYVSYGWLVIHPTPIGAWVPRGTWKGTEHKKGEMGDKGTKFPSFWYLSKKTRLKRRLSFDP